MGKLPTNCLNVFDHFVKLPHKGLRSDGGLLNCHLLLLLLGFGWVENRQVADRRFEIGPNIEKIVSDFKETYQSLKRTTSKSYLNIVYAVDDNIITVKVAFFSYLSGIFESYLNKY